MAVIVTENKTQIENSFAFAKSRRKLINSAPHLAYVLHYRKAKE